MSTPAILSAPLDARTIKQALSLADVARRYTRLRRSGRQFAGLCPLHQERHPSFYADSWRWHCFGCGRGGDLFAFLMAAEGCDFPAALRIAADLLNESRGVGAASEPRSGERLGRAEGAKPLSPRSGRSSIASPTKALWEEHRRAVERGARRALDRANAELPASMRGDLLLVKTG
jgi:CHC2 zinc finger